MTDCYDVVRPLFVRVNRREEPSIGLDFLPPWTTTDSLKQILFSRFPSLSSMPLQLITTDGKVLEDDLKLNELGPILDLRMERL
jgi:hypothetical protein